MPEEFSDPPHGIAVIDSGQRTMALQADVLTWANFEITAVYGVPASVLACFIYDAIKKSPKKTQSHITINETAIRFDKGEITEFIEKNVTEIKEQDQ